MKESTFIIQGGGGHAKVVLDCLRAEGKHVMAVIDEKYEGDLLGVKRVSAFLPEWKKDTLTIVAIGNNEIRKKLALQTGLNFTNAIHPTAVISEHVSIGTGCMILHRAVVQAGTSIGNHVIINTGAQADHDCVLGDYVHLAPRSTLCGNVHVGEGTLIGAGAVVIPGIKIGAWATVGAGAVIIKDVPDHAVVVGNPGKIKFKV